MTLQLKWRHQFQFAGYYAAIEKGYYKEAGINVNLIEAVEGRNPSDAVYEGKAEFGVCTSDILLMRSRQKNGVVLATVFQHSPQVLLASKQSGIEHVQDLIGKRIAMEPNAADIIAFMNDEGVSLNRCIIDQHKFNADKLINGKIDAISAYSTDEPFTLKESNFDYTIISPSMGGIDFYGDVLFTTEALIKRDPVLADNFRKASLKGWHYAMDHPQEIIELIYSRYSQRHSVAHLQFEAERMKHFIMADVVEPGYTNPGRWESIAETYKKLKMLDPSFTTEGLLYSDYVKQGMKIPWKWISVFLLIIVIIGSAAYFFYTSSVNLKNEIRNRLKTEKDLHDSDLQYRAILAASPDNITITDLEGRILMVSPAGVKMFGGEVQEEFIGLTLSDFIAPVDLERAHSNIMLMFQGIMQGPGKYQGLRANGTIFDIEVNGEFIRNAGGQPLQMIFVVRDISDRKLAESELKIKNEQLIQANAEKDKFFSIIAHDLRSPFNGFLGLTQLMADDLPQMSLAETQTITIDLRNSASNLFRLLENLLDWSRMEQGLIPFNPDVVQLLPFVNESLSMTMESAKIKGIEISCDIPEGMEVVADRNMLQTVIRNLVSNAVKFTRKAGNIRLSAIASGEKNVEISISDTGIGMSQEMVNGLFLLDSQTNRQGTGGEPSTGLGLIICKDFIEKHGGKLYVRSEEGKGSTFYFTVGNEK
ncbi:MAG: ABC transporter substrate-binding protein [Bacteroidales bacterium]